MLHFSLLQPRVSRLTLLPVGKNRCKSGSATSKANQVPPKTHLLLGLIPLPRPSGTLHPPCAGAIPGTNRIPHNPMPWDMLLPPICPHRNEARPYLSFEIHVNNEKGQSLVGIFPKKINLWAKLFIQKQTFYI